MQQFVEFMLGSFAALFPIVDPVGGVPIFLLLTADYSKQLQHHVAFQDKKVILRSLADTDEIEIIHKTTAASSPLNTPAWCSQFLGKKLQTVWVCENAQGYRDQIVFAFDRLHPSIAFIAEGSVLKVFLYEQVSRLKASHAELQQSKV